MGRQKQTVPLQRAPSSQLMHLEDDAGLSKSANGSTVTPTANGNVSEKASAVLETVADTPGLTQLVICVLGIYAAL
jgi:UDP-galactose transporter B1